MFELPRPPDHVLCIFYSLAQSIALERLDLHEELDGVHDTFHVLNIKMCLADPTLQVPLDEIRVDDKLNFVEEPMEIIEREFKKLKRRVGTGGRAGSGGGRTRDRFGNQGNGRDDGLSGQVGGQNLLLIIVAQVGDQGRGQGNDRNQNGDAINDHNRGDSGNATEGGVIVYTRWIEKMGSVHDMSGCKDSQRVKYTASSHVGKALTWLYSEIRTWGREIAGTLTDKAFRNGTIKKNPENRGNKGEHSKDRNGRVDNKRTRIGNAFALTANLVRGGYTGTAPKCTTCGYHHLPKTPCCSCFNCNRLGHFAKDCRVAHRTVNPFNARNPVASTCFECGSTDHIKSACPMIDQAQRIEETNRIKLWLLMRVRVMETKGTKLGVGHSCWEQRKLVRTQTS
uniref:CCHC-type domain-containing protein n=1 Tax=Tanacetum cinerariifolium TaxID=118510 RepID=A0A699I0I0_TANCI|nr:hypothetical protein [Tanacetum cinerariifolium]